MLHMINLPERYPVPLFVPSLNAVGGVAPPVTLSTMQLWKSGTVPLFTLIDSTQSANNRTVDHIWDGGSYEMRFVNDAQSAAITIMRATGGQSAGLSLLVFPVAVSTLWGQTSSITVGAAGRLQVSSTGGGGSQIQASTFVANATGAPALVLSKSRGATVGTNNIVADGDMMGRIGFYGANGTTYDEGAQIKAEIDGAPGSSTDMPGRLVFLTTPDASVTPTEALRINNIQSTVLSGRLQSKQGADVASANNLALGNGGNYFHITGTTQINLLSSSNWQGGSRVTLKFDSTPTVKHNQAVSGVNKPILLAGGVDFVATANDNLTLIYDSTDSVWYETARTVI